MGLEGLLGNTRLKENLSCGLRRGRVPHFYLISGPKGSGKHTLAQLIAASLVCRGTKKPCLTCSACRKALTHNHPDIITVDDPEKKTVSVELIRASRADVFVLPNEAERKVYIFPRAQDIGIPGQNALLKILEEPPEYAVFLLLTDNGEKLLPTVRSRCVELQLQALPAELLISELKKEFPQASQEELSAAAARSGGYLGQAKELLQAGAALPEQTRRFVEAVAHRDAVALQQLLVPMEKWKREQLLPELKLWAEILQEALSCRAGGGAVTDYVRQLSAARSARELLAALGAVQKTIEYAQGNVSVAAICGYLKLILG